MRRGIAVTLPIAAALVLAGCGTLEIIPSKTQNLVRTFVRTHTGSQATDVTCPSGVPAKAGNSFDCHFLIPGGAKYTAHMVIKQVHGDSVLYVIGTFPTR
jgi:hypothetical protein